MIYVDKIILYHAISKQTILCPTYVNVRCNMHCNVALCRTLWRGGVRMLDQRETYTFTKNVIITFKTNKIMIKNKTVKIK